LPVSYNTPSETVGSDLPAAGRALAERTLARHRLKDSTWTFAAAGHNPQRADGLFHEDRGRGILPEVREKIFQPFFTTRPGGTDPGLAIVARRVEEIGGSVECVSPVGSEGRRGSRFLVRFRAARCHPDAFPEHCEGAAEGSFSFRSR
jgi:hypothetical protein